MFHDIPMDAHELSMDAVTNPVFEKRGIPARVHEDFCCFLVGWAFVPVGRGTKIIEWVKSVVQAQAP